VEILEYSAKKVKTRWKVRICVVVSKLLSHVIDLMMSNEDSLFDFPLFRMTTPMIRGTFLFGEFKACLKTNRFQSNCDLRIDE
jgi:hypothetical protein